ncbi:MAG: ribonuclease R family protein [Phycisphaerae bacterium]
MQYIADHRERPLKLRALARALGVADDHYAGFRQAARDLLAAGRIVLGQGRRLEAPEPADRVVGVYRAHARGFGFVQRAEGPDLYVPRGRGGDALDGDTVLVRVWKSRRDDPRPCASVLRVMERGTLRWIGTLERLGARFVVRPHGRTPSPLIEIDDPTAKSAAPGDVVVVEALPDVTSARRTRAVIVEKLGPPTATQTKILTVLRRHEIPDVFAPAVRRAAQHAARQFDPERHDGREDLRELLTITIDPLDARDFDDAISIEHRAGGLLRLGVHIADVAHFVPEGGVLDREARLRGTSVYFPGYVVPMLPETLSNGVCSLQPDQPRLAKSVFLTYNERAEIVERRFANSVIRSHARLTYEQATGILDGGPHEHSREIVGLLRTAEKLARRIRERRLREGMIVLNVPEAAFQLDRDGRVLDARAADASFSHTIIEMFMVAANEAVSELLMQREIPHLRRIHPPPEADAAEQLAPLAPVLGRKPPRVLDREAIHALLDQVRGRPEELIVNYLLLRTLPQARYSPSDEGHFALASEDYCHFTSPIRRYPDLTVHRLLDAVIRGGANSGAHPRERSDTAVEALADLGRHASATERRAQTAARAVQHLLMLSLFRGKVGQEFDGVITSVMRFGAFVQVQPHLAEGLVPLEAFGHDDWSYDERAATYAARRTRRLVTAGQPVRVRVASVDEARETLVLTPAAGVLGVAAGERDAAASERAGGGRGRKRVPSRGRGVRGVRGRRR